MLWIERFDLFLFDFDGLLVNTEELHFAAYVKMCQKRGFLLNWDYRTFCLAAHFKSTGLRDAIYAQFPALKVQEPNWDILYAEKKEAYMHLLREGDLALMPGVEGLLKNLSDAGTRRVVATHSPKEQVHLIRERLPLLQSIPVWVTREDYARPKPFPDAYLTAIEKVGRPGDRIVGFEDSLRGFEALRATAAKAVLICSGAHPQLSELCLDRDSHFESFEVISMDS